MKKNLIKVFKIEAIVVISICVFCMVVTGMQTGISGIAHEFANPASYMVMVTGCAALFLVTTIFRFIKYAFIYMVLKVEDHRRMRRA